MVASSVSEKQSDLFFSHFYCKLFWFYKIL